MTSPAADLFGEHLGLAQRYAELLVTDGIEQGLLGPREAERVWERHILNSLALVDLIPPRATVVDVGSGAGLPGVPLAIARPDLHLVLLEPLLRRSTFLIHTTAALGLTDRVEVRRARAEDVSESFPVVVARAVAPLDRLLGWCATLRADSGALLALKGRSAAAEVADAAITLRRLRLRAEVLSRRPHPDMEATAVVRISSPATRPRPGVKPSPLG